MRSTEGRRVVAVIAVATAFLLSSFATWAAPWPTEVYSPRLFHLDTATGPRTVKDLCAAGRLLVQLAPGTTSQYFQGALDRLSGRVMRAFPRSGLYLVSLPAGTSVADGVRKWQVQMGVALAEPDRVRYALKTPNDPLYAQQYQWPRIDAPLGWDLQTGSNTSVVADVDSGVWITHPDLASKIWTNAGEIPGNGIDDDGNGYIDDVHGWNFVDNNNDVVPHPTGPSEADASHGTHVAGLIGAATNNNVGVAGQDWACRIMVCKVMSEQGVGYDSDIMAGITYAAQNGAIAINLSIGGPYNPAYNALFQTVRTDGALPVVAAGNEYHEFTDDPNSWESPVCNDGTNLTDNLALGVAATDQNDVKADFSNYDGSSTKTFVDVAAPGVDILSTLIYDPSLGFNDAYGQMSGTSMATPIVTGLVSLVHAQFPSYGPKEILTQIRSTADNIDTANPLYAGELGGGRINDAQALGVDLPPGPPRNVIAGDTPNDQGGSITVGWGKSVDDGRGENDVVAYLVQKCDNKVSSSGADEPDNNWKDLATLPAGSTVYVDSPVPNNVPYWYRVAAKDKGGNITWSPAAGPASARDDLPPPAIDGYLKASDTPADNGGSISLTWEGYQPPSDFATYKVYRSTKAFTTPSDTLLIYPKSGDPDLTSQYYQDQTTVDGTQYWYAVTAVDKVGNQVSQVKAVGPVVSEPNVLMTIPSGTSLLSFGLKTQATDLATVLGVSPDTLLAAAWDPAQGAYVTYKANPSNSLLQVVPGHAFFVSLSAPLALDLGGQLVTQDVTIGLQSGWNLIGNPFAHTLSWPGVNILSGGATYTLSKSNDAGITRDFAWVWNAYSNSYQLVTPYEGFGSKTVPQSAGFWLLSFQSCQAVLPASTTVTAASADAAEKLNVGWKLRLVARCGQTTDTDNFLGVSSAAATLNQIVSPPRLTPGVELYFANSGVRGQAAASFVTPSQAMTWQAKVNVAGLSGQQVQISWPDLSTLPASVRPVLIDEATGKQVYMRTATGYSFVAGTGEQTRSLEIKASQAGPLQVAALAARPAAQGVEVSFTLSAAADVSVEVLNISGRVIRRIAPTTTSAGPCSIRWNGVSDTGTKAPAGPYLVRVQARTADGQEVNGVTAVTLSR